ncbi:hypothetical protein PRIC1_011654 [Phytophthora ramorum]
MKAASVTILAAALLSHVEGVPLYVTRIPNGDNVPGVNALGHEDTTGDESIRNVFGIAFEEAGTEWTRELCEADSDEDGQTNGQELGDPCCIWAERNTPQWTKGVSHPGDDSKTSDESRWVSLDCEVVRAKAEADAEAKAEAEASKNSPDEDEDSEVDISMGDASAALILQPTSAIVMMLAAIPAVLQIAW